MSNLLKVKISRSSQNGHYDVLYIKLYRDVVWLGGFIVTYNPNKGEDEAVAELFDCFVRYKPNYLTTISVELSRLKIIDGFRELRANDLSGNLNNGNFLGTKRTT